jgi:hypothetical protein
LEDGSTVETWSFLGILPWNKPQGFGSLNPWKDDFTMSHFPKTIDTKSICFVLIGKYAG